MAPHEGPSERLPDPAPGCEPSACGSTAPTPSLSSRTHSKGQGTGGSEDGPERYALKASGASWRGRRRTTGFA